MKYNVVIGLFKFGLGLGLGLLNLARGLDLSFKCLASASSICLTSLKKTRMSVLADGEKKFENMSTHFDKIHECDGQTDGRTLHDGIDRTYT